MGGLHLLDGAQGSASQTEDVSPFLRARRVWDERWERLHVHRYVLAGLLAVSMILHVVQAVAITTLAKRSKTEVIYAETDRLGHSVVYPVALVSHPSETLIASELAAFIVASRTVTADRTLQRGYSEAVWARASQGVEAYLKAFYKGGRDPRELAQSQRIFVEVVSVLPLDQETSERDAFQTWQVRWREEHRPHGAARGEFEDWNARIDFVIDPPATLEAALENVAGLYVTGLFWTQERERASEQ